MDLTCVKSKHLMEAVQKNRQEEILTRLRLGDNVNTVYTMGRTALHCAAANTNLEAVSTLIMYKPDVKACDTIGYSALHMACSRAGTASPQIIEKLLAAGAEINCVNKFSRTALHECVISNNVEGARKVLDAGANKDVVDSDGRTARELAFTRDSLEMVELLASYGVAAGVEAAQNEEKTLDESAVSLPYLGAAALTVPRKMTVEEEKEKIQLGIRSPTVISNEDMLYMKNISEGITVKQEDLYQQINYHYAQYKREHFTISRYEHIVLENKIYELAVLTAFTKQVQKQKKALSPCSAPTYDTLQASEHNSNPSTEDNCKPAVAMELPKSGLVLSLDTVPQLDDYVIVDIEQSGKFLPTVGSSSGSSQELNLSFQGLSEEEVDSEDSSELVHQQKIDPLNPGDNEMLVSLSPLQKFSHLIEQLNKRIDIIEMEQEEQKNDIQTLKKERKHSEREQVLKEVSTLNKDVENPKKEPDAHKVSNLKKKREHSKGEFIVNIDPICIKNEKNPEKEHVEQKVSNSKNDREHSVQESIVTTSLQLSEYFV